MKLIMLRGLSEFKFCWLNSEFLIVLCLLCYSMKRWFIWNGSQTLLRIPNTLAETSPSTSNKTLPWSTRTHPTNSSRPPAPFLCSTAAAPARARRMCSKDPLPLAGGDVLEASALALPPSILAQQFNWFPLHPLFRRLTTPCSSRHSLPLRSFPTLRTLQSLVLWWRCRNKLPGSRRRRRESSCPLRFQGSPMRIPQCMDQSGNACIVRLPKHPSGGRVQWGQKPFAMPVESATSQAGSSLSTVLQPVRLLFRPCTPIPTRRFSRWEPRVARWLLFPITAFQNSFRILTAAFRWITCEGRQDLEDNVA